MFAKKGVNKNVLLLAGLALVLLTIVTAVNVTNSSNSVSIVINVVSPRLDTIYNETNLDYDRVYAREYLDLRHNFSDISFKEVTGREDFVLSMGNRVDDVRGFRINNESFAVHLVYCDEFKKFCKFRINGVISPKMYIPSLGENSFDFHQNYTLTIEDAKFNQCDNHRFCHLGYEGYHKVDVRVDRK